MPKIELKREEFCNAMNGINARYYNIVYQIRVIVFFENTGMRSSIYRIRVVAGMDKDRELHTYFTKFWNIFSNCVRKSFSTVYNYSIYESQLKLFFEFLSRRISNVSVSISLEIDFNFKSLNLSWMLEIIFTFHFYIVELEDTRMFTTMFRYGS